MLAGSKLYSFGGWNGTSILNSTETHDISTSDAYSKGWQVQPWSLNVARAGFASVVVGNKIYAMGGIGTDGKALASVEVFDTLAATPSWTFAPSLTTARANAAAAVIGTKIYVFGGEGNGAADNFNQPELDSIEVLDTASANPVWQQVPAKLSSPREAMGAVTIGNTIYLIGGVSALPNPYADPSNQYLQHVLSEVVSTVETFTPGRTVYLFSKN